MIDAHISAYLSDNPEDLSDDSRGQRRVYTGIKEIDFLAGGFMPGEVVVIGCDQSNLREDLIVQLATNSSTKLGVPTLLILSRRSAKQTANLAISSLAQLSRYDIRKGRCLSDAKMQFLQARNELVQAPLYIEEFGGNSHTILDAIRAFCRERDGAVTYIDNLQDLVVESHTNRYEALTEIIGMLHLVCKTYGLVLIAGSQINRQYSRNYDQPMMPHHLRDSGELGDRADIIIFMKQPPPSEEASKIVSVPLFVQKIKWAIHGTRFCLEYDRSTGRFYDSS